MNKVGSHCIFFGDCLVPDITMCHGDGCPLKDRCYRHTATPTPHWQSYFIETPYDDWCEYLIPNGKQDDKPRTERSSERRSK